jgi:hypothetical protein
MRFGIAPDKRADRHDVTVQSSKRIAPYGGESTGLVLTSPIAL